MKHPPMYEKGSFLSRISINFYSGKKKLYLESISKTLPKSQLDIEIPIVNINYLLQDSAGLLNKV